MEREAVFEQLREVLRGYAEDPDCEITLETDLLSDIGLNSFDVVQILTDIEDVFEKPGMMDHVVYREVRKMAELTDYVCGALA